MISKGIVLAGGSGTRLHPMTKVVSKQLLPIFDKPIVYYPVATLMMAGLREILVISTPVDMPLFYRLLRSGNQWGMRIEHCEQPQPSGIAQAFMLAAECGFLNDEPCALILGDNLFFGHDLPLRLATSAQGHELGAVVFGYEVSNPSAYGVAELGKKNDVASMTADLLGQMGWKLQNAEQRGAWRSVTSLEEKPEKPRSNCAVAGLYMYDETVVARARALRPSARGELEITDLNRSYMADRQLALQLLGRGVAWLDTGTASGMLQAAQFVATLQERQGLYIASPEEVAFRNQWIDARQLRRLAESMGKTEYGKYLLTLAEEET
jgi:glucose-1-phosphate thymidylyltransferase